jgi:hypothetical protein
VAFRLFARRTILVPTLGGWLIIAAGIFGTGSLACLHLAGFLSPYKPMQAQILVVEGWLPDYCFEQAKIEFESKHYRLMVTTGGPIEIGGFLSEYGTFAQRSRTSFLHLGIPDSLLVAVPSANALRNRSRASAEALKNYLDKKGITAGTMNLVSLGAHSRRSALLFQSVLGKSWHVGVLGIPDRAYDADRWWMSSEGFRVVTDEAIAFVYAATIGR